VGEKKPLQKDTTQAQTIHV